MKKLSNKIRIFDFDDTIATSKSMVLIESPKGVKNKLNAEEFAKYGEKLMNENYKFDFSEFDKVIGGEKGPLFNLAKRIKDKNGNKNLFILTARSSGSQEAIHEFLKSQNLEFKKENIIGLGDSTGIAKAKWIMSKIKEGYNDVFFADDAESNTIIVKKLISKLNIKYKIQLVK